MTEPINILYMDDYPLDRELVRDVLEKEDGGFEVVEAASRAEFETRLAEGDYDLVLSDFNTLGFEGLQVIDTVRAEKDSVPVVILTGTGSEEVAVEAIKRGAADYVVKKPHHIQRLPLTLRAVLDRVRAEEALRESEERYRLVFENSPVSIWEEDFSGVKSLFDNLKKKGVTDIETYFDEHPETVRQCAELIKIIDVNRAARALHGAATKEELLAGLVNTFTPESFDTLRRKLVCLWNGGTEMTGDAVVRTLAGESRHVTVYFSVCPGYEETLSKTLVSLIDITERKRVEQSIALMNFALNNVHETAFLADENPRLHYVNEEACRVLGYTREELLGLSPAEVNPGHTVEGWLRLWNELKTRKSLSFESHHTTKDGRLIPVEISHNYFEYEGQGYDLALGRDITERKRAEEALKESEEQFRTIVKHSTPIVFLTDQEGTVLLTEGKMLAGMGLQPGDLVGESVFDLWKDYPAIVNGFRMALGGELFEGIIELDELIFEVFYSPRKDLDGNTIGVIGMGLDITERKRGEEALRQAHEELEMRVIERTSQLKKANEHLQVEIIERKRAEADLSLRSQELARSNADLEQFAYVASHDLQEPLRMVASYLQLLERRYKDKLDSDANEFIGFAVDGARRMQALITDLLVYSRIGTRSQPFQPVDCEQVLEQATTNLRIAIQESGSQITHTPLPSVWGDATQLTQLFQNLIGNAIKFRSDRPPEICIRAEPDEDCWRFSVQDNGIGIEPRHFERIFMVFQRLHSRSAYAGTGIGLAICKKIVERHGGAIWVESEPGQGATFYFTIPKKGDQL